MRLISAHCSTPTTRLLLARTDAQARVRTRPDTPDPAPGGSLFDRPRWVSIPGMKLPAEACCPVGCVASGDRDRGFWENPGWAGRATADGPRARSMHWPPL